MNILHFVADGYTEFNSSHFRVSIPATAIHKSGKAKVRLVNIQHWLTQSDYGKAACAWADVIILQRVLVSESIDWTKHWTQKGKAVVIDFDDAYDLIRDDNAAYKFWYQGLIDVSLKDGHKYQKEMEPHPIDQFTEGLQYVTAVTTPSKTLCDDWDFRAPAFYLPNYIDTYRYERANKRRNDKIVIGWGGSLSHVPSFSDSGVKEALGQLFSERGDIKFLLVGDTRVLEHLPIAKRKLIVSQYVKFSDWPQTLLRYDIGLAPLYDKYDCRRSHLKVMEYQAMALPFVATRSSVYQEFFDSKSGRFVDQGKLTSCDRPNPEGWHEALSEVVSNYNAFRHEAFDESERFEYLYDVDMNVDNILGVYKEILKLV